MSTPALALAGVDRTLSAIDDALALDFTRPLTYCGAGSVRSAPVSVAAATGMLETATLVVEIRCMRLAQREAEARFDAVLVAAQAAVVEGRASAATRSPRSARP